MQVWARRSGGSRQIVLAVVLSSVLAMVGCSTSNSASSGDNATALPTFKPGAGTYNSAQTVTIADTTPGAVLYCTTDGTTPTTSSPQCSQPTTVYKTEFLQAIAVAPGKAQSTVGSAAYTINFNAAATPTFTPAGGTYTGAQTITINDGTAGANIYYTLDGTVPTVNSSTLYTVPIAVSKSATLSAIAVASGYSNSGVASAQYVISSGTQVPVISPAGGTFSAAQNVTITDATQGATIYYTVDGSTPSSNSTPYSGSFTVSGNATVSAIAISAGGNSAVTTATFVINLQAAAAPSFNPATGPVSAGAQVTLSSTTPNATIYYTTDNSNPTTSSQQYQGAITVNATETIRAIAIAPGYSASSVSSATYTISSSSVVAPTFNPAGGTFSSAVQVTLSSATQGATIHYTTDGNPATISSQAYSTAIPVNSGTVTINAIAELGGNPSPPASATYTISAASGSSYSGKVMSGTGSGAKPVAQASVQMYVAGSAGYGLSSGTVGSAATTGSDGSFTLHYTCPAAPTDLVYIVATGGQVGSSGGGNALVFMAALGPCNGTLPTSLVVNEVTTVASAYALAQFMTGAQNVGSSSHNYQDHQVSGDSYSAPGLTHAFATVANLVDLTTGQARDRTPTYQHNLAEDTSVLNNSTVPQARINMLANALNACATDNSKCSGPSGLFSAATPPPPGTAPSDTLQAILNIAQNPGNQASAVYGVASGSGSGAFTPVLYAAPNDWTVALTFTGGGLGFAPDAQIQALAGLQGVFTDGLFQNTSLAIDATGNIWVTGFTASRSDATVADLFSGMVAKFDNLGNPLTPVSSLAPDSTPTYGGFVAIRQMTNNSYANSGTLIPRAIAIDPSGNAWITGGSTSAGGDGVTTAGAAMTEITPGLSVSIPWISLGAGLANVPIAIDSVGNVWTENINLQMFDSTGTQHISNQGVGVSGNRFGYLSLASLIFEANATSLWGSDARLGEFYQINPADGSGIFDYSWVNGRDGTFTNIVADSLRNIYGCRQKPGQMFDVFNATSTSPAAIASYPISTNRGCGQQMVMDGAGHIFAITGSTGSTITPGIIDEFSVTNSGITALTPSGGYTGTGNGETPTINGDPVAPILPPSSNPPTQGGIAGAAIDGSGNLWVLNADTGTSASRGNVLVEFVGLAAPVVTPTSLALQFGQVGGRP